jgi:hypothetical protein
MSGAPFCALATCAMKNKNVPREPARISFLQIDTCNASIKMVVPHEKDFLDGIGIVDGESSIGGLSPTVLCFCASRNFHFGFPTNSQHTPDRFLRTKSM